MRIAAGVVLIIAGLFNIFGAIKYIGVGAFVGGGNKLVDMAAQQSKKDGRAFDEQKARESVGEAKAAMGAPPGVWLAFGSFMFVTVGTSIACAVCLFRGKAPIFCIVACLMALAAEIVSIVLTNFGPIKNGFGIVGAILGLVGARMIMVRNASSAEAPPAAAPM
jgi:hypothetical protein